MPFNYKRNMARKRKNYLEEMARMMFLVLVTLISVLEYITDIRHCLNSVDVYFVGLLDGIMITIGVSAVCLYRVSKFRSK